MFEDVETSVILLYIGAFLVGAYLIYDYVKNVTNSPDNSDPETGQSNGPLNGIMADIFPSSNPGGGAATGTSETYTGAASEFIAHPYDATKAILGW